MVRLAMTQTVQEQPSEHATPKFRWAWPLRISAQIVPGVWVWKLYGCMQMMDCSDPTHSERLIAHALLAGLVAFGVEIILLVNRALDSME
jgi:hypothetical protein